LESEPDWLSADLLIDFNKQTVEHTGEPFLLRDKGLLESAVARPRNLWCYGEGDVVILAISLLIGIACNHPFMQGNKRTAFAAADYFLYQNGYELTIADGNDFADLIVDVITGNISESRLIELFSDNISPA
jgi:death-on-curing protein